MFDRNKWQREWRRKHPERTKEIQRKCYQKNKDYYKEYAKRNKEAWLEEMKRRWDLKCSVCGYDKCEAALDFHHIVFPKEIDLCWRRHNRISDKIIRELNKCTLLCANCHREVHYGGLDVSTVHPGGRQA